MSDGGPVILILVARDFPQFCQISEVILASLRTIPDSPCVIILAFHSSATYTASFNNQSLFRMYVFWKSMLMAGKGILKKIIPVMSSLRETHAINE
jgi:hypothetical protein